MEKLPDARTLSFNSVTTSEMPLLLSHSRRPPRSGSLLRSLRACFCFPSRRGPDSTTDDEHYGPRCSYLRLPSTSNSSTCSVPARVLQKSLPPSTSLDTSSAIPAPLHSIYGQVRPPPYDTCSTRLQLPTVLRTGS